MIAETLDRAEVYVSGVSSYPEFWQLESQIQANVLGRYTDMDEGATLVLVGVFSPLVPRGKFLSPGA